MLGKVMYELAQCSVDAEFSFRHTVEDEEAVKNELLGKAVEDSRVKAKVLARAAGVKLGEIKLIDYSWGRLEVYSDMMSVGALCCDMAVKENASYDIDIEADDIYIEDTVTVVWELA